MNTKIVIHLLPFELIQYERILKQLKEGSYTIDGSKVSTYITFNLSDGLFNWDKSGVDKATLLSEFNSLNEKYLDWCNNDFEIIHDESIMGTTAQKRKAIREKSHDVKTMLFLDTDIYFHEDTLAYMLNSIEQIDNRYFVLTPQTVKLWDYTWDVLTNQKFMDKPYKFEKTFDVNEVLKQDIKDVELKLLELPSINPLRLKFACGWFTLYSSEFLRYVDIPDSFGHYGPEDTFAMYCGTIMMNSGADIAQYTLEGIYIAEDYIYQPKKYMDKLSFNNYKQKFRDIAEANFNQEVKKFHERIKNDNV